MSSNNLGNVTITPVATRVKLGEGPHWDSEHNVLYYVDIPEGCFYKYDPKTEKVTKCSIKGDTLSLVIPVAGKHDEYIVSHGRKILFVKWDGVSTEPSVTETISEVDSDPSNATNRFNDGKCDPFGRLYAGTMGLEEKIGMCPREKGNLYRFDSKKSSPKLLANKVSISNGLAWDLKLKRFYYIDSLEYRVDQFNYDDQTGDISNRKPVIDFKKAVISGLPDGMTIDEEGKLWIACFNGNRVIRVDPSNGKLLETIHIPAKQVTSVVFGGSNLDVLYVTTAALENESDDPNAGQVFKVTGMKVKGTVSSRVKF